MTTAADDGCLFFIVNYCHRVCFRSLHYFFSQGKVDAHFQIGNIALTLEFKYIGTDFHAGSHAMQTSSTVTFVIMFSLDSMILLNTLNRPMDQIKTTSVLSSHKP
jgi:hypothetical protein